jgi:hypothetical protein
MRRYFFSVLAIDKPASTRHCGSSLAKARQAVALNSVYRILDLFVATNLAASGSKRERLSPIHSGMPACIFLICGVRHRDAY